MEIRYYKGKRYLLIEDLGNLSRIQEENKPNETRLVETINLLTEEEFQTVKDNRRSTHVNWIN